MSRLIREPFVQFLLLGAVLFLVHSMLGQGSNEAVLEGPSEVVVDAAFVRGIRDGWQAKRLRPPTERELVSEINNRVRQEVLYREGLARGLDTDDLIIKRRVAQKMTFLAEELSGLGAVTDAELRAFHAENPERFEAPAKATFSHVYFAGDTPDRAAQLKARIEAGETTLADSASAGDATLLPASMRDADAMQVAGTFGRSFADALLAAKGPGLLGPLQSDLGWHLVLIESVQARAAQPFDAVQGQVRREAERERGEQAREAFYRSLRKRVGVRLEGVDVPGLDLETL